MARRGGIVASIAAVALLLCASFAAARTPFVVNVDQKTLWKVTRPDRITVLKFDREHPHGWDQDNFVRFAGDVAASAGVELLVTETRIKNSDANDGGASMNIPIFNDFNCSIQYPTCMHAMIPRARVEWRNASSQPVEQLAAAFPEFDLRPSLMTLRHKTHYSLPFTWNMSTHLTEGKAVRWVNAILTLYPALEASSAGASAEASVPVPRSALVKADHASFGKPGTGFVLQHGISRDRCQALAAGTAGWSETLAALMKEADERRALLEQQAQRDAEIKTKRAELAAKKQAETGYGEDTDALTDEIARLEREAAANEERVANTHDGKLARAAAAQAVRQHAHRTWLMDLLRKMLDTPRHPARRLPRSKDASTDDQASKYEERREDGKLEGTAAGPNAWATVERVLAEEEKLRAIEPDLALSMAARTRADWLLSALWCVRQGFEQPMA